MGLNSPFKTFNMTKKELLPLAKQYFDSDPNRKMIYGTEDKHFFNTEGDARYHCKDNKEYFQFVKDDFDVKLVKEKEVEKEKLNKEESERQEELIVSEQIKKEELLKKRQEQIAPYSNFKSRFKLDLETSEGTFKKLLADLKKQDKESKTQK